MDAGSVLRRVARGGRLMKEPSGEARLEDSREVGEGTAWESSSRVHQE
jgi:hypothetical protein